jgi:hypothetical protein
MAELSNERRMKIWPDVDGLRRGKIKGKAKVAD